MMMFTYFLDNVAPVIGAANFDGKAQKAPLVDTQIAGSCYSTLILGERAWHTIHVL